MIRDLLSSEISTVAGGNFIINPHRCISLPINPFDQWWGRYIVHSPLVNFRCHVPISNIKMN